MAIPSCIIALNFHACGIFGNRLNIPNILPLRSANLVMKKPLLIEARANQRMESPKIRDGRSRKKFNGTARRPRLSVFCSDKQLYAMLVDDQNKKCLFYGSTLQKQMRSDPSCSTAEAAERVGEELVKACVDLNIIEISSYDRNGLSRGERMQAFEIAIDRHGFLMRPHGSNATSRDWSVGPHKPYWRTNTSFSPPPSRWEFPFQPEAVSFGSHDGIQLYGSSASSNSRESRSWARGNNLTNHQFLVSDGIGPYLSSPADIAQLYLGS